MSIGNEPTVVVVIVDGSNSNNQISYRIISNPICNALKFMLIERRYKMRVSPYFR